MIRRLTYWYPAICVAILISVFSTHVFSGDQTAHIIIPILRWLLPSASLHTLRLIHFGIRKAAHITEFGVFSIALFHGVRGGRYGWRPEWALITVLIATSIEGESFLATEVVSCRYGITAAASFELMLSSPLPSTAVVT